MKKLSTILVIVIVLLTLTACGQKPETTARSFLDAIESKDYEKAKDYTTEEGAELLTMMASMGESMGANEEMTFTILETTVEGDSAQVKFEMIDKGKPETKDTNELQMVKVDGKWKVHLSKDNPNK